MPNVLADAPPRPDATVQPLHDGCQRNPVGLLTFTSPEWVFVNRDPSPKLAEGIVHTTNPATGDLPETHRSYDFNWNLDVDPQYQYLNGGDPQKKTGNFQYSPPDYGRLHGEWEEGTLAPFARPTEGDRMKVWGSWVWDCGHWGQKSFRDPTYFLPGSGETPFTDNVPGEGTEFHPPRAVVVTRANSYRARTTETQADAFVSSDGTGAYADETCALANPAPTVIAYPPTYTACDQMASSLHQPVNDSDYSFFVPAPPKPSPSATLRYHVVNMIDGKGPEEIVKPRADGIDVTIPFKGFGGADEALAYGKSFFVGWSEPDPQPPAHLRVVFESFTVHHSLDPSVDAPAPSSPTGAIDDPGGEWNVYADLNGSWQYLNAWEPRLISVNDGDNFKLDHPVDIYVARGQGVRLFMAGRECDLLRIAPCSDSHEQADDNDGIGEATATFASPSAAVGEHTLAPKDGNYTLSYRVEQLSGSGAGSGPGAGGGPGGKRCRRARGQRRAQRRGCGKQRRRGQKRRGRRA
ncbi:MAG TPA: hypothetical protein VHE14_08230 [Solirubrobacteraceae bacterium]|nr:hypothetical protein [Solirubrobacteraceae bacterium]